MDRSIESIMQDVRELDPESQIEIANKILSEEDGPQFSEEWLDEAERLLRAYQRGEMTAVDHDEVMSRARKRIDEARRAA